MQNQNKCCAEVNRDGWHIGQCARSGVVFRDGKWYCKQHDPVAVKEKSDKRWEEFKKKSDQEREKRKRREACENAMNGISDPESWVTAAKDTLRAFVNLDNSINSCDNNDALNAAMEAARKLLKGVGE